MQKDISKQIEAIIERKFDVKPQGGYDPKAVDSTLDEIIDICNSLIIDWNSLCERFEGLQLKHDELNKDYENLHQELLNSKAFIKKMESSGIAFAMVNERLNKLENAKHQPTDHDTKKDNENKAK